MMRKMDLVDGPLASARVFFNSLVELFDFSDQDALDMFAANGQFSINNYVDYVDELDAWELMYSFKEPLSKFGIRELKFGCSYKFLEEETKTYGLIVADAPCGFHTDYKGTVHLEHFDVLKTIGKLVRDKAVIVLYCNKRPYNLEELSDKPVPDYDFNSWMKIRSEFYLCPTSLLTEERMLEAYRRVLVEQGLKVKNILMSPCFSDVEGYDPYVFRLALEVTR